ncbi:hypothetical protein OIDMADRAFT_137999, partial [Oidiodendron maius Zn]
LVDADPELFVYILRYIRRGVLPCFYDNEKGHDFSPYLAPLGEAEVFQIPRLENWLKNKGYLTAVKVRYTIGVRDGQPYTETLSTDTQAEYHPVLRTRKVYICPYGNNYHRGDPATCEKLCGTDPAGRGSRYGDECYSQFDKISFRYCPRF